MLQIFKGVKTRDSDIRNLIRYNDLPKVYNHKNRISILKSEIDSPKTTEEKIEELKVEIKIMLQIIEDSQLQIKMTEIYKANKHRGFDFLESLLDGLYKNYNFIK